MKKSNEVGAMITKEFIAKAKEVHGNKYDYSNVNYINSHTKVCIICPEHGKFWQMPISHLQGQGCPNCNHRKINTLEFIEKAIKVHGNKYIYKKVNFENSNTKVCIICPEHGEFWQTPHSHLQGQGCPNCNKKTTTEFIEKIKKLQDNQIDYNDVNNHTKVCIVCPEHGEFWQTIENHLNGHGCPNCNNKNKMTNIEFIKKAKEKHGDKYDYSKVDYINNKTKVCIICPKHGEFWQTPHSHLSGYGCIKCIDNHNSITEFIKKAKEVHGNKYDYSKVMIKK